MPAVDKIVVVTRKTALEELIERLNTRDQARFYIEHLGGSFDEYQEAHDTYKAAVERLKETLPKGVRRQWIDRSFLPTFTFGQADLVVTLGPDGLVVNTAKYLDGQPLLAVNPDPKRVDGILVPFGLGLAAWGLEVATGRDAGRLGSKQVTMALATLNDGQSILAVNDLFLGQKTHVSARYRIESGGEAEDQSSSGIIVSTGAGSTGWYRSIVTGAAQVLGQFGRKKDRENFLKMIETYRFDWESDHLVFNVREPFVSKTSAAEVVTGRVTRDDPLVITSNMPQNGVIFSDGIEEDFLPFNSGAVATIGLAPQCLNLLMPEMSGR